jgi:hypothetical protein
MTVARGNRILISDIINLTFFPIGIILPMDGSWEDGRGGWYICDGQEKTLPNGSKRRTPNLINKFVCGGTAGKTGGTDSVTLSVSNIPSHPHNVDELTLKEVDAHQHGLGTLACSYAIDHTHTVSVTLDDAGSHAHKIHDTDHTHTPQHIDDTSYEYGRYLANSSYTGDAGDHKHSITVSLEDVAAHLHELESDSVDYDGEHTHTISGRIDGGGSAVPVAFGVVPAYYTVIYIEKLA